MNVIINNAAGNFLAPAEDLKPKGFQTVMEIDALGVFTMCHAAFPHLKKAGDAVIINTSATLHHGATWFQVHASAAKAAIDSLTRTLALEWGEFGIKVVGIAPGPIADTAGLTKLGGDIAQEAIAQYVPLGRLGTKWDIAMTAVFICSSAGSYVTGDTIVVDGAQRLWRPSPAPRDMIASFARGVEKKSRDTGLSKSKL